MVPRQHNFSSEVVNHPWYRLEEINGQQIDVLSLNTILISCLNGQEVIQFGSGFFINFLDKIYLITNYHVVYGNSPNDSVLVPDFLEIEIKFYNTDCKGYETIKLPLFSNNCKIQSEKLWIEHNCRKEKEIDVIAYDVTDFVNKNVLLVFPLKSEEDLLITPSENVSVIGFPKNLDFKCGDLELPIWKTGFIASDFYTNEYYFYIDANTKEGMSGSPVFIKKTNGYICKSDPTTLQAGVGLQFLGVYSGRKTFSNSSEDIVGKVFKYNAILEILTQ